MIYFYHFRPTVKQLLELPAVKKAKERRARELYLKHTVQSVKSAVESALWPLVMKINQIISILLLQFGAFFRVISLLSIGVDNRKVGADNRKNLQSWRTVLFSIGVDNEKALELDNRFFSYFSLISIQKYHPKKSTKHLFTQWHNHQA